MSVLHLLGTAGDGGAETYFVDLVTGLARAGVPQAVALRRHAGRQTALKAAGVPFKTLGFGGPLDILTKTAVAGYAHVQTARLILAWMNRAARHAPSGPWARIGRLGGYYNLKYYAGFDELVANTEDIADWIVSQGWPADRVRYIPNFAAAPVLGEGGADVTPVDRESLDTPPGAPLLLAMGRLHEAKAHDVSLQALALLPEAFLWIAGVGPQDAKLKALAEALGVQDRVRFLGWRDDPSALYLAADLCLFPSRYEPLGNVVIQAWAHGLPVIAAKSQGPKALIDDGRDGVLIPIDDANALAEAVRALIADPKRARALAQRGLGRVAAEFSEAAVVGQWKTLFTDYGAA